MPELPEVETIRRDLARTVRGRTIRAMVTKRSLRVRDRRQFQVLVGLQVTAVNRRGKLLLFTLHRKRRLRSVSLYLAVHLRMTGQLIFSPADVDHTRLSSSARIVSQHYVRAIIFFRDGTRLSFFDVRRFGWMGVMDEHAVHTYLQRYGIEPLTAHFVFPAFRAALRRRRAAVKHVLLDQKAIAGLGNIYADEVCFYAGVRPDRIGTSLSDTELQKLHRACIVIVRRALACRGTTFSTFRDGRGQPGHFGSFLAVYGRAGEQCRRCVRGVVAKMRVAGRGTSFCQTCQH